MRPFVSCLLLAGGLTSASSMAQTVQTQAVSVPGATSVLRLPAAVMAKAQATPPIAPSAAASPSSAIAQAIGRHPGNAAAQGYSSVDPAYLEALAADAAEQNSPYQLGQRVAVPVLGGAVGHQPEWRPWLGRWTQVLARLGVPREQIAFEANRLQPQAFAEWATRRTLPGAMPRGRLDVTWVAPRVAVPAAGAGAVQTYPAQHHP